MNDRYIELFGGSGAAMLGKETPDKFEVYNDYNKNLVNLFRCIRERPMAFIKGLGFLTLNARDDFTVIKDFFKKEKFNDRFLSEKMELTKIMLPELRADELLELQQKSIQEKGSYVPEAAAVQLFKRRKKLRLSVVFGSDSIFAYRQTKQANGIHHHRKSGFRCADKPLRQA